MVTDEEKLMQLYTELEKYDANADVQLEMPDCGPSRTVRVGLLRAIIRHELGG